MQNLEIGFSTLCKHWIDKREYFDFSSLFTSLIFLTSCIFIKTISTIFFISI